MSDDNPDWTQRVDVPLKFTVMSDTPGGYGNAGQGLVVNDTEIGLGYSEGKVDDHSTRHEDGGADPITNLGGNVAFPDRSYWVLKKDTDQDISAGVDEKVSFDTVVTDNRGEFDSDNNRVIVENAGFYLLCASIYFNITASGDRLVVWLYLNGSNKIAGSIFQPGEVGSQPVLLTYNHYLSGGDFVEVLVLNSKNNDTVRSGEDFTFFTGCLIA